MQYYNINVKFRQTSQLSLCDVFEESSSVMIVTMDGNSGDSDDSDSSPLSSFCYQLFQPLLWIWPGIKANGEQQTDLNAGAESPAPTQYHHMEEGEEGTAQVKEEVQPVGAVEQMDARDQEMEDNYSLGTSSSSTTVRSGNSLKPNTNSSKESVASNGMSRLTKPQMKRQLSCLSTVAKRRVNAQKKNGPGSSAAGNAGKKRISAGPIAKQRRERNFSRYIFLVLKQVWDNISITKQAMDCMNCFMNDMFERITVEASKVAKLNRKVTITEREMQTAVKLIMPTHLGYYGNLEGTKAIRRYRASINADLAKKLRGNH